MSAVENQEVCEDSLSSQLVKPHPGLAAAIARVLSGEQETNLCTVLNDRPSSTTQTLTVKRKHRAHSDEEGSDEDTPPHLAHHQSELVQLCHRAVHNYPAHEERKLQRSATRGVVQLFNAVSKHQKSIEDKLKEVGPSERKKHKILSSVDKGGFIDLLKKTSDPGSLKKSATKTTEPSWHILRDDYLKSSKLQDWDKDTDKCYDGSSSESDCGSD